MSLTVLFLAASILFAVLVIAAAFIRRFTIAPSANERPAYQAVALFTPAERSFFGVLQQAVRSDYLILVKVRLADIVRPVQRTSRSAWQSAFNRISGKHVDFVLCNSDGVRVLAVVELDDATHARLDRAARDGLVDSALADAGIPVLRVSVRQSYSPTQLRQQVETVISSRGRSPGNAEKPLSITSGDG